MAVSNITCTETVKAASNQPHRQAQISLDLDDSYPTGGYAVSLAGITNADGYEIVMAEAQPSGAYRFWWDSVNEKLKVLVVSSDSASEVANGTNLAAVTGVKLNCILK